MANMGDLVTRLIADASQYTAGTDQARAGNKALSGSIDSIIGQLERQKKQMASMGQTTQDNIIRQGGNGASEGSVNYALQLNNEIEALRESKIAQDAAQAAKNATAAAGAALLASLRDEAATLGMTSAELRIYRAEMAGVNPVTLAAARSAQANIAAMNAQATANEEAARKAATVKQAGDTLIANLTRQASTFGQTTAEITRYNAAQAGVPQNTLRAASAIQHQIDIQQGFERSIQRQITAQRSAQQASLGQSRGQMALIESTRGLEDAVAGYTNNGLKGMLMATTNNTNQIGSLIGGTAGLALSIGSIAALIGVSLLPKLLDWASGTAKIREEQAKLESESQTNHDKEMKRIDERYKAYFGTARERQRSTTLLGSDAGASELKREEERLKQQIAEDREIAITENRKQAEMRSQRDNVGDKDFVPQQGREEDDKAYEERKKAYAKAQEQYQESVEAQRNARRAADLHQQQLQATQTARERREATEARQQMMADQQADADKETQEHLAQEKRRAAAVLAARKQAADTLLEMIKKASPAVGEQIEKKRAEEAQRKSIEDAQKRGIITADEANNVLSKIGQKENVPAGGPSAAVQSGSTAAYSAALKAMRKPEDDKQLKADKENTEKLVTVLEKIEKKDPVTVTTMTY